MDLTRIIRFIFGIIGVAVTGVLLYYLWRIYSFVYLNKKSPGSDIPEKKPSITDRYKAPTIFYDAKRHEFFMQRK